MLSKADGIYKLLKQDPNVPDQVGTGFEISIFNAYLPTSMVRLKLSCKKIYNFFSFQDLLLKNY